MATKERVDHGGKRHEEGHGAQGPASSIDNGCLPGVGGAHESACQTRDGQGRRDDQAMHGIAVDVGVAIQGNEATLNGHRATVSDVARANGAMVLPIGCISQGWTINSLAGHVKDDTRVHLVVSVDANGSVVPVVGRIGTRVTIERGKNDAGPSQCRGKRATCGTGGSTNSRAPVCGSAVKGHGRKQGARVGQVAVGVANSGSRDGRVDSVSDVALGALGPRDLLLKGGLRARRLEENGTAQVCRLGGGELRLNGGSLCLHSLDLHAQTGLDCQSTLNLRNKSHSLLSGGSSSRGASLGQLGAEGLAGTVDLHVQTLLHDFGARNLTFEGGLQARLHRRRTVVLKANGNADAGLGSDGAMNLRVQAAGLRCAVCHNLHIDGVLGGHGTCALTCESLESCLIDLSGQSAGDSFRGNGARGLAREATAGGSEEMASGVEVGAHLVQRRAGLEKSRNEPVHHTAQLSERGGIAQCLRHLAIGLIAIINELVLGSGLRSSVQRECSQKGERQEGENSHVCRSRRS
eukprot:m.174526 g.174526  ORF g.174526 m.174526 type:complete len:521 (+) comp15322_c1_seq4:867-2429(+)